MRNSSFELVVADDVATTKVSAMVKKGDLPTDLSIDTSVLDDKTATFDISTERPSCCSREAEVDEVDDNDVIFIEETQRSPNVSNSTSVLEEKAATCTFGTSAEQASTREEGGNDDDVIFVKESPPPSQAPPSQAYLKDHQGQDAGGTSEDENPGFLKPQGPPNDRDAAMFLTLWQKTRDKYLFCKSKERKDLSKIKQLQNEIRNVRRELERRQQYLQGRRATLCRTIAKLHKFARLANFTWHTAFSYGKMFRYHSSFKTLYTCPASDITYEMMTAQAAEESKQN